MSNNYSFDKAALRTLSEKYLARTILEEIMFFLKINLKKSNDIEADQVALLLSDRAGKSRNSVYKNKNEFTNYSAISLLRYWQAMISLCHENNVPEQDIPSLDDLLNKHVPILEFINQIAIENNLTILIQHHPKTFSDLFNIFKDQLKTDSLKPLNLREKAVLQQIAHQPLLLQRLNEETQIRKDDQIERMKKK